MFDFEDCFFNPSLQNSLCHIDRNKPLQIYVDGNWIDCEIGKCFEHKIGIYYQDHHIWVFEGDVLRNKKPSK